MDIYLLNPKLWRVLLFSHRKYRILALPLNHCYHGGIHILYGWLATLRLSSANSRNSLQQLCEP